MSFTRILDRYRKISFSERDKGDRFERLMQAYLQTDPKYAYLFEKVWLHELIDAPVDWEKLEQGIHGEESRIAKKVLRPHQTEALEKTHEYLKQHDRGKLIMACGTGKTFNALRIAEHETRGKDTVLFLVPSIALLGQILREWRADSKEPINAICICSDPKVSKSKKKNPDSDSFSIVDLAMPASTDSKFILHQYNQIKRRNLPGLTVVFSTYQSIDVVSKAQKELLKNGFDPFDLIICDEAHRTTGATLAGEDESAFTKVHDNSFIQARKRLYMTATPRLYSDDVKSKAAIEWIMDRYQVKTDKKSGITNDPNDWAREVGSPRYILDLLLSIINLSIQTVAIVESLPKLEFE